MQALGSRLSALGSWLLDPKCASRLQASAFPLVPVETWRSGMSESPKPKAESRKPKAESPKPKAQSPKPRAESRARDLNARGRTSERRPRLLHRRRDGTARRIRAVRADGELRTAPSPRAGIGAPRGPRPRRGSPPRADGRPARGRRIVVDVGRTGAARSRPERRRHSVHLRPRAQHDLSRAGARLGRSPRCPRHRDRRQRARLLRVP